MNLSPDSFNQLTLICSCYRDSMGSSSVVGDTRWTGMYGINADLIARTHCSVEVIKLEGIKVYYLNIQQKSNDFIFYFIEYS